MSLDSWAHEIDGPPGRPAAGDPAAGTLCLVKPSQTTRARAGAAALLAVAATTGCSYTSPFQTDETMSLGDGVPVDIGDLELRNLVVVSGEEGGEGTLTGTAVNTGSKDVQLQVAVADGGEPVTADVPPGEVVLLGEGSDAVKLSKVPAPPGAMAEMTVATGSSDVTPVSVPVLPPTGYYEEFAPPGYTPPAEPSESETESEEH
ncbi:hypothetical protein ABIB53_002557 [Janibacter sp. UYMM211]